MKMIFYYCPGRWGGDGHGAAFPVSALIKTITKLFYEGLWHFGPEMSQILAKEFNKTNWIL